MKYAGGHEMTLRPVARRDYRLASMVADAASVFAPSGPPLTLADCAPSTTEGRYEFYLKHGFVVIHDAIPKDKIAACQVAWLRLEPASRQAFEESVAEAEGSDQIPMTFYGVDGLCEAEDAFIDLMDNPRTLPLMALLCGHGDPTLMKNQTDGVVRSAAGNGGRIVPPDRNPDGYCCWHRDMPAAEAWPRPKARYVKTFTAIWDVPLDGGEGACVAGSHRLLAMPQVRKTPSWPRSWANFSLL